MTTKPGIEDIRTNHQLDLIKLVKAKGLNPSDIFTEITIGLDVEGLLAQTNKVVRAIVEQIKRDNDN